MQTRWARWARYPALDANPVPVPGTWYPAECLTHPLKNTHMGCAPRDEDLSLSLRPFKKVSATHGEGTGPAL